MKALTNWWRGRGRRKQAKEFLEILRKERRYQRDLWSDRTSADVTAAEEKVVQALKNGTGPSLQEALEHADKVLGQAVPRDSWHAWRENVEVFLVAIVAALAIQAYFVKPFKIPTDSMKPTLYGIQAVSTAEKFPAWPQQIIEFLVFGRSYVHLDATEAGELHTIRGGRFLPWFEYTDLSIGKKTYRLWVTPATLAKQGLIKGQIFQAGENVVHYRNDTGDQVLVNKIVYNFRKPNRGEVFVFKTTGIEGIEGDFPRQGIEGSQYYIKRCVGVPGDELRVDSPYLYINGEKAHSLAFDRVHSQKNDYHGYGYNPQKGAPPYLASAQQTYRLDQDQFWAMGDNSYNSLDSRYWGPVPRENLVGTALIVYWPFGARWGVIR
jgi:signal peptidase I